MISVGNVRYDNPPRTKWSFTTHLKARHHTTYIPTLGSLYVPNKDTKPINYCRHSLSSPIHSLLHPYGTLHAPTYKRGWLSKNQLSYFRDHRKVQVVIFDLGGEYEGRAHRHMWVQLNQIPLQVNTLQQTHRCHQQAQGLLPFEKGLTQLVVNVKQNWLLFRLTQQCDLVNLPSSSEITPLSEESGSHADAAQIESSKRSR